MYSTPGDLPNETDLACPGGNAGGNMDDETFEMLSKWEAMNAVDSIHLVEITRAVLTKAEPPPHR